MGLTYTWLRYQKKQVKREIKWKIANHLDRDELTLLKFSSKETKTKLQWKHSKEFEYNGDMYDIVTSESRGDSIVYWCWWDNKETQLNKQLAQLVLRSLNRDPQNQNQKWQIQNIIKSLFHSNSKQIPKSPVCKRLQESTAYMFLLKIHHKSILDPPPELS
jgi:hypothetical protein